MKYYDLFIKSGWRVDSTQPKEKLLKISSATIDRLLKSSKFKEKGAA